MYSALTGWLVFPCCWLWLLPSPPLPRCSYCWCDRQRCLFTGGRRVGNVWLKSEWVSQLQTPDPLSSQPCFHSQHILFHADMDTPTDLSWKCSPDMDVALTLHPVNVLMMYFVAVLGLFSYTPWPCLYFPDNRSQLASWYRRVLLLAQLDPIHLSTWAGQRKPYWIVDEEVEAVGRVSWQTRRPLLCTAQRDPGPQIRFWYSRFMWFFN